MRQNGEPSVEEILQSIKQVIARDSRPAPRADRTRRPAAAPCLDDDDVLELQAAAQIEPETEPDTADEPALLDEVARESMRGSLAALAMLAEPGAAPQIVRSGETSLEGMVRDMLRPALAEWLDRNLPPMVERLVAAEIARIVGKKG